MLGAGFKTVNTATMDIINTWLKEAWTQLTGPLAVLKPDGNRFYLPKEHMTFFFNHRCPDLSGNQ